MHLWICHSSKVLIYTLAEHDELDHLSVYLKHPGHGVQCLCILLHNMLAYTVDVSSNHQCLEARPLCLHSEKV